MPNDTPTGKYRTMAEAPIHAVAEVARRRPITVLLTIASMLATQGAGIVWGVSKIESAESKADSATVAVAEIKGMVTAMYQMQMMANQKAGVPVVEAKTPVVETVKVVVPVDTTQDTSGVRPR